MTHRSRFLPTTPSRLLIAGLVALASAGAARAGDEPSALTRALGLRTTVPEAPDFVVKTRHPNQDFIPVHTPRAKPDGVPMVKDEVAKTEKSLDAARIRQDRLVGRKSAPRGKSVADAMETAAVKPKPKAFPCGLTCPSPGLLPSRVGKEAQ